MFTSSEKLLPAAGGIPLFSGRIRVPVAVYITRLGGVPCGIVGSYGGRPRPDPTMVAMLPIAAMLGKADTAFKAVGGSSIIFNLYVHRGRAEDTRSASRFLEGGALW